jgi:hypothetical protein
MSRVKAALRRFAALTRAMRSRGMAIIGASGPCHVVPQCRQREGPAMLILPSSTETRFST